MPVSRAGEPVTEPLLQRQADDLGNLDRVEPRAINDQIVVVRMRGIMDADGPEITFPLLLTLGNLRCSLLRRKIEPVGEGVNPEIARRDEAYVHAGFKVLRE